MTEPSGHGHGFDWIEYSVFTTSLMCSVAVGVYYGFFHKENLDTVEGYVLGGKKMQLFPVALSLVSSFISGITLLSIPAETYVYGSQYMMATVTFVIHGTIIVVFLLPVFYRLQFISLYEYLELRFDQKIRKFASLLFAMFQMMYIPIVIYGPALAMNQVTGVNVHLITPIVCMICIFYTTIGGLKAVVWADTIQTVMMAGSMLTVAGLGVARAGGVGAVIEAARQGDRLEFFNLRLDPASRQTLWTVTFGLLAFWGGGQAVSPCVIQRFISLPSERLARHAVGWYVLGACSFLAMGCITGLIIYANYKDCDPIASQSIRYPDQLVPFFVSRIAKPLPGLLGLFLAGVFAAALSTMSTGVNTIAATVYEDFILPLLKETPSNAASSRSMKWLSFAFGIICVALVFVVEKLGTILELCVSLGGGTNGTVYAVFLLGIFYHRANAKGCMWGMIVGMLTITWIIVGNRYNQVRGLVSYPVKPVSTTMCGNNVTNSYERKPAYMDEDVLFLFKLSGFYHSFIGFVVTLVVTIVASNLTGGNDDRVLDPKLFTPMIRSRLPRRFRSVPTTENAESLPLNNILNSNTTKK
ncbi:Sodium:solute symporter family [Nesidiocoris tenuis]|uniref:Sodium:solute symporter family n=1 Tax=Nesidiocoris tenuis TaxID=355587 RepID=A0ABN7AXN7_9HEMI|nr:Sodium:solute symporter family [Nesidiocoris tenuis]